MNKFVEEAIKKINDLNVTDFDFGDSFVELVDKKEVIKILKELSKEAKIATTSITKEKEITKSAVCDTCEHESECGGYVDTEECLLFGEE